MTFTSLGAATVAHSLTVLTAGSALARPPLITSAGGFLFLFDEGHQLKSPAI